MENTLILLFDGYCNLCSGFVRFIIKRDKKKIFRFASLQSTSGIELTQRFQLSTELKTVYLIDNGENLDKSQAVFRVASHIGFPWSFISVFKIFGSGINDGIYDFVAKNRYSWFGKKNECMLPTEDVLDRFLS